MNANRFRGLLMTVLIVSLCLRFSSIRSRDQDIAGFNPSAAVSAVLRAQGLNVQPNTYPPTLIRSTFVYFERPGCSDVSIVAPFGLNYEVLPLLNRFISPQYARRFVYLDREWPAQDRVGMYLLWLKHSALAIAGTSHYLTVKTGIVIADPPGCGVPDKVDWRQVWDRARFEKAAQAVKPVWKPGHEGSG